MRKLLFLLFCIYCGANLGHLCRVLIIHALPYAFPVAILASNCLGSFLLGGFYGLRPKNSYLIVFIGVSFLGTLTTFSTFIQDIFLIILCNTHKFITINDTIKSQLLLLPHNTLSLAHAFLNLTLNLVLCLICVYFGKRLGHCIVSSKESIK